MIRINAPDLNSKTSTITIPVNNVEPVQGNPPVAGEFTILASCDLNFHDARTEACYLLKGDNNTFWICSSAEFNAKYKR
jgi:hypothetical protein